MKIGIYASNTRDLGGQFQFLIMFLDALFTANEKQEIYLFYFTDSNNLSRQYRKDGWKWINLKEELELQRSGKRLARLGRRFLRIFQKKQKNKDSAPEWIPKLKEALLHKHKLDFIFFPVWTDRCWEWGVPFGFAVHDLQHRLQPEFPEISLGGRWRWREKFFSQALSKADIILVDSQEGKENALRFYGCSPEKIKILPYTVPSGSMIKLDAEKKQKLTENLKMPREFLFYPAQFWPHKNHYRIIESIGFLKKKYNAEIPVVFAGKSWPEWEISAIQKTLAEKYSIEKQIYHLGYVNDEELVALYAAAKGLVMPTFFGPTNIPYIEAFYHGCPVIASDIPGIREQVGEAALLVDPKDTEAISEAIYKIWTDENLRQRLIEKGRQRLKEFTPERFKERLNSIIEELACSTRK